MYSLPPFGARQVYREIKGKDGEIEIKRKRKQDKEPTDIWYHIQGLKKETYIWIRDDTAETKMVFDRTASCDVDYFLFYFKNMAEAKKKGEE